MAGMSKYLALAVYNMALNPVRSAYNPPAGLWLALHTDAPSDSSYGHEANFAGYQRQPLNSLTAVTQAEDFDGNVNLLVTNGSAVAFAPSNSAAGQTITHWSICDVEELGGGNILFSGSLGTPRLVENEDSVVIPEGAITLLLK